MAYEQVELASVPFLTFVANKGLKGEPANYSFVLRGYVRHWLGNVWAEYDRIKLNDIVATGGAAPANSPRVSSRQPLLNGPRAGLDRGGRGDIECGRHRSTSLHRRVRERQDADRAAHDRIFPRPRPAAGGIRPQSARAGTREPLSKAGLAGRYRQHTRPDGAVRPADRRYGKHQDIDLGYSSFDQFFAIMAEIDFLREARRRLIEPIVLFVSDPAAATVRGYAELRSRSAATFVPVHNKSVSLMFAKEDFPGLRAECGFIRIPRLSPIVRGVIDRPSFSFAAYMTEQPGGPTEVHQWVSEIFR